MAYPLHVIGKMRCVLFLIPIAISLNTTVWAQSLSSKLKQEGADALAKAAREDGDAIRGAVLFPNKELGCGNCHVAGSQNLLGPDLMNLGELATDKYLVEAMLEPSKTIKKGYESVTVVTRDGEILTGRLVEKNPQAVLLRLTVKPTEAGRGQLRTLARNDVEQLRESNKSAMPDNLVDLLTSRQQFLDLVKYMIELAEAGNARAGNSLPLSARRILRDDLRGLVLLDKLHCTTCHSSDVASDLFSPKPAPRLAWSSGRINPDFIERFIADPLHTRPGTTMPDMLSDLDAAARLDVSHALTHYIVSLGENTFQFQPVETKSADRGHILFHSVGCVACHSPRADDAIELLPSTSVPLGKLDRKYNIDGLVALLEDPHDVRPSGRMPNMQLAHGEAVDIAHYLLQSNDVKSDRLDRFLLDRTLAEKGKQLFQRFECFRCHGEEESRRRRFTPLSRLRNDRGCLSNEAGNWPKYQLDAAQRTAIIAAIHVEPEDLTNNQRIDLTLTAFNCVACHRRNGLGGVSDERDDYFQTTNPNLGPQGRIPPPLSGVGAKLNAKWMREVLVSGRSIRPYMKTRMPQFGTANVAHLVQRFQQADTLAEIAFGSFSDQKEIRNTGGELVGSQGLNCIACHTFQLKSSQTMSAVDLTEMADRLKKDWFYHYMSNPQRLSPGTVMPSFWPGGRALRKEVLDGDPKQQIESLWQYLLDGRQARRPRGLIIEPIELTASDEAVMLRRAYQGIGKRGIGVGFPGQVNLAFDAEQMRLAMIWKGKFADPGGVWRSQGHGTVRPLGRDRVRFAAGPELDDASRPWHVDKGRPPQHSFRGYFLDDKQRPTLMYRFEDIDVEDYSLDVKDEATNKTRLRRMLTFGSPSGRNNLVFRAATGKTIVAEGANSFLIDKALHVRVDANHEAHIEDVPDGKRLLVPLDVPAGKSTLVLEYVW
jgi:putative heme-binding domain-containing protein